MGSDDDAFHSQVICPSEDSESILCCSNIPGGTCTCVLGYNLTV